MAETFDVLGRARNIRAALEQLEEAIHNADGTSAQKFETLKGLLENADCSPTRSTHPVHIELFRRRENIFHNATGFYPVNYMANEAPRGITAFVEVRFCTGKTEKLADFRTWEEAFLVADLFKDLAALRP